MKIKSKIKKHHKPKITNWETLNKDIQKNTTIGISDSLAFYEVKLDLAPDKILHSSIIISIIITDFLQKLPLPIYS